MHVYIDEAGPFATPRPGISKISCVGSLVLPTGSETPLQADYDRLRLRWGSASGEIKGGSLLEEQAAELIAMLIPYDVVVHVATVDMGLYTNDAVTRFKYHQADSIVASLPPHYPPALVQHLHKLRARMLTTSNPLTAQMYPTVKLLRRTLQIATPYYARHAPAELGDFQWLFDAKDIRITPYEQVFPALALAFLMRNAAGIPQDRADIGGDYSYLNRYLTARYASQDLSHDSEFDLPIGSSERQIQAIFAGNFTYADSQTHIGLQLADNVVTICRRALNGTLQETGWGELGRLFVNTPNGPLSYLRLNSGADCVLTDAQKVSQELHAYVIAKIADKASLRQCGWDIPTFSSPGRLSARRTKGGNVLPEIRH